MDEKFPSRVSKHDCLPSWEDLEEDGSRSVECIKLACKKFQIDINSQSILEVGSGRGAVVDTLRQENVNIIGVDVRPRASSPEVPQVSARIEQLPFSDSIFDIVFSSSVFDDFDYNQNQVQMISEICRVLKPGGLFISRADEINCSLPKELTPVDDYPFVKVYQKSESSEPSDKK